MVDIRKGIGEPVSATDWLIALREQPNDRVLREKLDIWLANDPARQAEWNDLQTMALLLRQLPADADDSTEESLEKVPSQVGIMRFRSLPSAIVGGILAVMLLLYVGFYEHIPGSVYATGTGQSMTVELTDGSIVALGPDTTFSVNLDEHSRRVTLHEGRAFFTVTKDATKPFVVASSGFGVVVLGTEFEVAARGGLSQVVVENGTVSVKDTDGDRSYELRAGDRLQRNGQGAWRQDEVSSNSIARWRSGLFVANNGLLSTFVSELSAYHNGLIYIADDKLQKMSVTGVFDLKQPEKALDVLARSLPIKVRKITPWLFVLSTT